MKPWFIAVCAVCALLPARRVSRAEPDIASSARSLIVRLDLDDARRELAEADADDPRIALERARLAIYQLDCDAAVVTLSRPDVLKVDDGPALADIARGCQRVTAALVDTTDEVRGIEVRWQDDHDTALAQVLLDTVEKARNALTRDLEVDWPRPTRVVVVRDLLSLSAVTGLPYSSAQTTGTVAVAKWGRITLLSPRASSHGYSWRDTIAHELTHLAVTRASGDQAPLWLQEGVAKREEVRWRPGGPFDDRPPPEAIVQRGLELGLVPALDKLGPSIAMLPSADAAMVAFAEVTSFVGFYIENGGPLALSKLLLELKNGKDANAALASASGANLKAWDRRWRAYIDSRPHTVLPALLGIGGAKGERKVDAKLWRDLRDRSRLAQLLLARGLAAAALTELDRLEAVRVPLPREVSEMATDDPSMRWLRGRALEEAGRAAEGEGLFGDPKQVLSSYGLWWATRGRRAQLRGDEVMAADSFEEAFAVDPLEPEVACEAIDAASSPRDPARAPVCEAARARGQPPFDAD
jgi:hypothetical protein